MTQGIQCETPEFASRGIAQPCRRVGVAELMKGETENESRQNRKDGVKIGQRLTTGWNDRSVSRK